MGRAARTGKHERFTGAIGAVYDAALGDASWQEAIRRLCRAIPSSSGGLLVYAPPQRFGVATAVHNLSDESLRLYREHYWSVDIWKFASERIGHTPLQSDHERIGLSGARAVAQRDLRRDPPARRHPPHVRRRGVAAWRGHRGARHMAKRAPGPVRQVRACPDGARAAACRARDSLAAAALQSRGALGGADGSRRRMPAVYLRLRRSRRPDRRQCIGRGAAEARHVLGMQSGRLRARDAGADLALRNGIEIAKRASDAPPPFIVSSGADARAMRVGIVPLPRTRSLPAAGAAKYLVIAERIDDPGSAVDKAARRFGLTRAETELLRALVAGRALGKAAIDLGRSYNTARYQLQAIFAKTGTHRQAQLVSSVLRDRLI